jgi:hypothetical protein
MAEDDDVVEDIQRQAQDLIDDQLQQQGIVVPTGVSEDEAVQMVQEQFSESGFECPDDQAREIVREAWAQQQ